MSGAFDFSARAPRRSWGALVSFTRHRPALPALLLALCLPACTFWAASTTPLPELTGPPRPVATVRVTTAAGDTLELQDPRVHGDSLVGGSLPDTGWVFLPLASIGKVEVRKKNALRTIGTGALIVALVYGVAVLCTDVGECTSGD